MQPSASSASTEASLTNEATSSQTTVSSLFLSLSRLLTAAPYSSCRNYDGSDVP